MKGQALLKHMIWCRVRRVQRTCVNVVVYLLSPPGAPPDVVEWRRKELLESREMYIYMHVHTVRGDPESIIHKQLRSMYLNVGAAARDTPDVIN